MHKLDVILLAYTQASESKISWDGQEDRQEQVDKQAEDNPLEGNLELEGVAASHKAAHMLVGMDIQLVEESAD